jgi:hypothetical protein
LYIRRANVQIRQEFIGQIFEGADPAGGDPERRNARNVGRPNVFGKLARTQYKTRVLSLRSNL